MGRFNYAAYDSRGGLTRGNITAENRDRALEALNRRGQIAFELSKASAQSDQPWWQREVFGAPRRLSAKELAAFTGELASLIKAEVQIDEAIRIVSVQPMLPSRLRQLTRRLLDRVLEGEPLSAALASEGNAFPEYYRRLVGAGETSGALSEVFQDLAQFVDRSLETRSRIGSALVYPIVLLVAALIALSVIIMVLIPTILPIFADAGATPPVLISALSTAQRFMANHASAILIVVTAVAAGMSVLARDDRIKIGVDRALLRLPLIGTVIERRETARLARTLCILTRNGVPILDTLHVAAGVMTNRSYAHAVLSAREEVKAGVGLTIPLAKSGLFPDLFLRLTAIGEKTGQLDKMQLRAAEIYEASAQRQVARLTTLITPVLTLVIGGCVGGLMISVMNAIFAVNDLALK